MKIFHKAAGLYLLAGVHIAGITATPTLNTYTRQFCFTRYTTSSVSSISTTTDTNTIHSLTISTYHPANVITITPQPTTITSISISVATSTKFEGPTQTVTSNSISTVTVIQTTTVSETTNLGPIETVTISQSTLTVPTSPGFIPLASDPAVIAAGGAESDAVDTGTHKELKDRREVNVQRTTIVNVFSTANININNNNNKPKTTTRKNHLYKNSPRDSDSIPEELVDPDDPAPERRATNVQVHKTTNVAVNINGTPVTKSISIPHFPHWPPRARDAIPDDPAPERRATNVQVHKTTNVAYNLNGTPVSSIKFPFPHWPPRDSIPEELVDPAVPVPERRATNVQKTTNVFKTTNVAVNINGTPVTKSIKFPHWPPRDSIPEELVDPAAPAAEPRANNVQRATNVQVHKTTNIAYNLNGTPVSSISIPHFPHWPPRDSIPEPEPVDTPSLQPRDPDSSTPQPRDLDPIPNDEVKPKWWWFNFWSSHDKLRYPYLVRCEEMIRVVVTQVITLQPQQPTTTTLPPDISTSVVSETSTSIITQARRTTTTVIQVETVTSVSTEKDVITNSAPTTTTASIPQATQYDMCQPNNIVSTVGGTSIDLALPLDASTIQITQPWVYVGNPSAKSSNCCALCAQSSTCVGYAFRIDPRTDPGVGPYVACELWEATDGVCDPAIPRYEFQISPHLAFEFAAVVGNGNCGRGNLTIRE
ncbi:hypothetical protein NHQ30_007764 [Ciborinia camelliae]|nr:hypothetical protein NHQ30_007764 [Ciborinia camelliae]